MTRIDRHSGASRNLVRYSRFATLPRPQRASLPTQAEDLFPEAPDRVALQGSVHPCTQFAIFQFVLLSLLEGRRR